MKKNKTEWPFIRAYNFILQDKKLSAGEKFGLMTVCRFWPKPTTNTNRQIAELIGHTERYVEMILASLRKKNLIRITYQQIPQNGKLYTCRVIFPMCFETDNPNPSSVSTPNPSSGSIPKKPVKHTEPQFDLQYSTKKDNKKTMPTPSPANGQASASQKDKASAQHKVNFEQLKSKIGIGKKFKHEPLPEREFDEKRQKAKNALLMK
jgi:hypothetical protein